jgi:hypothetical protein
MTSDKSNSLLPKISYQLPKQSYRVMGKDIILLNLQVLDEYGLTGPQHAVIEVVVGTFTLVIPAIIIGTLTGLFTVVGERIWERLKPKPAKGSEVIPLADGERMVTPATEAEMKELIKEKSKAQSKSPATG